MDQKRSIKFSCVVEYFNQCRQVVAINRSDVVKPQCLKQGTGGEKSFQGVLGATGKLENIFTKGRNAGQQLLHLAFQFTKMPGGHLAGYEGRKSSDIF